MRRLAGTGEHLALALWAALLWLLAPLYRWRLRRRGRLEPLYRQAIGERFGRYDSPAVPGAVWIHAVSLGETRAAAALIAALRRERPGLRLLLTHGTATGRAAGAGLLREGDRQVWQPVDLPGCVERFLGHFQPTLGVLMETEVWPRLLYGTATRSVPVLLANARLSEKSLRRGRRLGLLLRPAFARLSLSLAQTDADAERLRQAGAREVVVCGNLKFDMTPDARQLARGAAWRRRLGRPVVLAASSREGEEALLLDAWRRMPASSDPSRQPLLLVVPRHPQRFDEVGRLMAATGLAVARRSGWNEEPDAAALDAALWLGDSVGEMPQYFAMADVALLGGSFAPLGGQNLIEAAACGCPLVMGPHTFNFEQAAEQALAAGAAFREGDFDAALRKAQALVADEDARAAAAAKALGFAAAHRGAADRMAAAILRQLG